MYLLLRILYNLSIPNYCYLSRVQLLVDCSELTNLLRMTTIITLHCTVQFLKYAPVASIIGWQVWEPGVRDLRWGSLLQCTDSWNGPIFWDRSHIKTLWNSSFGDKTQIRKDNKFVLPIFCSGVFALYSKTSAYPNT